MISEMVADVDAGIEVDEGGCSFESPNLAAEHLRCLTPYGI